MEDKLPNLSDRKLIDLLECRDIPDTRKIQKIVLDHIVDSHPSEIKAKEENAQTYIINQREERWYSWKEINTLSRLIPKEIKKEIYSLAIPLSTAFGEFWNYKDKTGKHIGTYYSDWVNGPCGINPIHITSLKNIDKIWSILSKFELKIERYSSDIKLCELDRNPEGIIVPYRWNFDQNYDSPSWKISKHIFLAWDKPIFVIPYFFIKDIRYKEIERKKTSIDHFSITEKLTKCKDFTMYTASFCNAHLKKSESWIKKEVKSRNEHKALRKVENKVMKIGEPVLIYDPGWV
ncbi:MAG: hypothetical protein PHD81_00265 [Candidatus Nanoarchaeia archaeon]|nr:hypothetical protein [Candidatus Nanoarchaeia archaeon]MDD5587525.1 hypothetical protein [Candidatus Nanoarchaeia archaeon]